MSFVGTFSRRDLDRLEALYQRADAVVPMRAVHAGATAPGVIGLRHDVDDNAGSLDTALAMAAWEAERSYSSTWYLLHDSHYWPRVQDAAVELERLGHEVGIHVNAVAEALQQDRDPADILAEALETLGSVATVTGCVAHGDRLCHVGKFVNDEMFKECRRPSMGAADRSIEVAGVEVRVGQSSLADFGLEYDANWLPRAAYLSESGGRWSQPFDEISDGFPIAGQLHMLVHPDWWAAAFSPVAVAA